MRWLSSVAALLALSVPAHAQLPFTEDVRYALNVPTLQSVVGHAPGEDITSPAEAIKYMERLAEAHPDRVRLVQYAESYQGRPLVYAMISSKENMARLDEIKAETQELASGERQGSALSRLIDDLPAITWLSYGVHGDEISSTDAGLAVAYHLLAAQDDDQVDTIMENSVVVIDPMQNPDGRARFMANFDMSAGIEPQASRYSAERDQPWPGGRYNNALFDLNRDWFQLAHPETRGKVAAFLEWNPVVFVDAHEMGSDSTYFFAPSARPFNPQVTDEQKDAQAIIGRANAAAFDAQGIPYYVGEVYDLLYPGYGDSWPTLNGAIGMTYEQSSARGLLAEQKVGAPKTYADTVLGHFTSTLTTASTVAENREAFLRRYATLRSSAIEEGRSSDQRYTLIDLSERAGQAEDFARRMTMQGIDVQRLPAGTRTCGRTFEEGALVVDRAAPNGRLITTLLDRDTPMADDFIAEQEERRAEGLGEQIYDVTAWSVPLMDDLSVVYCARADLSDAEAWAPVAPDGTLPGASFGYAINWNDAGQARLLVAALRAGLHGKTTDTGFTYGGQEFERSTVIFTNAMNEDLRQRLSGVIAEVGGEVTPMADSWTDEGPQFGSGSFRDVLMPKVAVAWGEGTSPLSAGAVRYVLERDLGIPVTPIRVRSLGREDLSKYDVLVMPETGFGFLNRLGGGAANIAEFAREGGVVVAMGSATRVLSSEQLGLLDAARELKAQDEQAGSKADGDPRPGTELWKEEDYRRAIADSEPRPDSVPGVLLRADANENHWMSSGYDEAISLFRGSSIYAPLKESEGTNVFTYKDADNLLASGFLWEDVRTQLARKPFVMAANRGDGVVIAFTQDPTVRAYLNGLDLLVANSVVLAPAYTD